MLHSFVPRTFLLALLFTSSGAIAADAPADRHVAQTATGGIWKAAVPAHAMHGEFDSFDPIGLAAGSEVRADCSLNWIDPDNGKRYCFSSGTSLVMFLEMPKTNIERAVVGWNTLQDRHH
jgi:hypothetical protein